MNNICVEKKIRLSFLIITVHLRRIKINDNYFAMLQLFECLGGVWMVKTSEKAEDFFFTSTST